MAFLGPRWMRSLRGGGRRIAIRTLSSTAAASLDLDPNRPFEKLLVANRGEIACRIIRSANAMGLRTVAVFSDADANSLHVALADEAIRIGPASALESYLKGDTILEAARRSGAQALHPGYGFLSENAGFARQCASAGVAFVGPPPKAIDAMGSKSVAKAIMSEAGVPVCPGYHGEDQSDAVLEEEARRVGFPLMIKAVMGGGGKGMRLVTSPEQFQGALEACRREAAAGFADDRVLLERFVNEPRHVEVQVFADTHGNAVHLYERDCSVQRRHQKVLEEAPAPGISKATRAELGQAAVRAAEAVGYVGAGTVEFLMDTKTQEFFFCEMNTRLQVEHPVTEMVTGLDLVEWQIRVAKGETLPLQNQAEIPLAGHAIEARICAENVARGFLPAAGTLRRMRLPQGVSRGGEVCGGGGSSGGGQVKTRVDTGVEEGDTVTVHYDPMVAKLIVHAPTRPEAISGLRKALREFQVVGLPTNLDFCERVAGHRAFERGGVTTAFLEEHGEEVMPAPEVRPPPPHAVVLAAVAVLLEEQASVVSPDDHSPWSAGNGPWRAVGVRKQRLMFALPGASEGPCMAALEVNVDCLADGGYDVELEGERFAVRGAELDAGGGMMAIVDGRRYSADATVEGWGAVGAEGEVTLWCRHGALEGDDFDRHRYELTVTRPRGLSARGASSSAAESTGRVVSPMPGRVVRVLAEAGQEVDKGQELIILEAMKMEHAVPAPFAGNVGAVSYVVGDLVDEGSTLVTLELLHSRHHAITMSARRKAQTGCVTLQSPRMTPDGLEVSLHTCPRALFRELRHVFPGVDLDACLAVPTSQKADIELVSFGDTVETEKDRLLNSFARFASGLCKQIREAGYWADYIDPCSGLPMLTGGNKVYSEVEGMQLLLQYRVMNAGSCKVLLHPQWGSAVYPASLFCNAPSDLVQRLLEERLAPKAVLPPLPAS
eukprot:g4807.t1